MITYAEIMNLALRRHATDTVTANNDEKIGSFKQDSLMPRHRFQELWHIALQWGGILYEQALRKWFFESIDNSSRKKNASMVNGPPRSRIERPHKSNPDAIRLLRQALEAYCKGRKQGTKIIQNKTWEAGRKRKSASCNGNSKYRLHVHVI